MFRYKSCVDPLRALFYLLIITFVNIRIDSLFMKAGFGLLVVGVLKLVKLVPLLCRGKKVGNCASFLKRPHLKKAFANAAPSSVVMELVSLAAVPDTPSRRVHYYDHGL